MGSAAPALATRYLNGPAIDQILAEEDAATSAVSWMLQDRQGSVTDITNNAGTVVDHIFYDSYGKVLSESDATVKHTYGYAGYFRDAATGFLGTQTRWYDPAVGRWTSEDWIGFAAGDTNLSRYVGNGPTNAVDPTGLVEVNYIPGRLTLKSAIIKPRNEQKLSSEFDVLWNVDNASFLTVVNDKQCKLCDEIGIFQIVEGTGTQLNDGVPLPGSWWNLNYSWQIDTIDRDPAYGQPGSKGGVVRGDQGDCVISHVSKRRRSPISIATGGWVFLAEYFSGRPKAEARAGAVVE